MTTPRINIAEFVTVADMVAQLEMSRTRYYQLVKQRVFLPPVYNMRTRRPICTRSIVERNLLVRKTHVGIDGNPVLFNNKHSATTSDERDTSRLSAHGTLPERSDAAAARTPQANTDSLAIGSSSRQERPKAPAAKAGQVAAGYLARDNRTTQQAEVSGGRS
jgi:hypothetical protein